jgi:cytochrome P450
MTVLCRWADVVAAASAPDAFGQYRIGAPSAVFSSHAMASCDDDEHRTKRDAAHVLVSRARLERARVRSRSIARELVDAGVESVHDDLALPLAMRVLLDLLGLPETSREQFAGAFANTADGSARRLTAREAMIEARRRDEVAAYIQGELLARMHEPRDDALGEWVAALSGHDPRLVIEYLVHEIGFLFFAGTLPVARAITGALAARESELEEILRLDPPVPVLNRVARRATTIAGVQVPAGTLIELSWQSANRDPQRPSGRHVSFGFGVHRCLGAALARIEIAAALEVFDISDNRSHI